MKLLSTYSLAKLCIISAICFGATGAYATTVHSQMKFSGVNKFVIKGLAANVNIQTTDGKTDTVTLKFSGDDSLDKFLADLDVTNSNDTLTLRNTSGDRRSVNVTTRIVNGKVVQNTLESLPTLDVTLSQSTAMKLYSSGGTWTVGDTHAPFDVSLNGAGSMNVGAIAKNTEVNIAGTGTFAASSVSGDKIEGKISGSGRLTIGSVDVEMATFRINGTGKVGIDGGKVSGKFDAAIAGTGSLTFSGRAQRAKLKISGIGNINIKEVTGDVDRLIAGLGTIKVGNQ